MPLPLLRLRKDKIMKNDAFSTYNPIINFTFYIGAIVLGMFFVHPMYLAVSVFFSFTYLFTIQGKRAFKTLSGMLVLFVILSLINPLFNTYGQTVLFTYFNGRVYTLEALYYGMATSSMVISVLMWFNSYNLVMTSDKFMYIFARFIPSLSLIFTMVLRLVPNYERKIKQISSARKCIGMAGETEDKSKQLNDSITVVSALTSWALEGAIITGDSMRSRGYGTGNRSSFSIYSFKFKDKLLVTLMLVLMVVVIIAASFGATYATYTPELNIAKIDNFISLLGIVSYILLLCIPTVLNIREEILWKVLIKRRFNQL